MSADYADYADSSLLKDTRFKKIALSHENVFFESDRVFKTNYFPVIPEILVISLIRVIRVIR